MIRRACRRLPVFLLPLTLLCLSQLLPCPESRAVAAAPEVRHLEEEDIVSAIGLSRPEVLDLFDLDDTDDNWPAEEFDSVYWPGDFVFEDYTYKVRIELFEGRLATLHLEGEEVENDRLVEQARRLVGSRSRYYDDPVTEDDTRGRLLTALASFEPYLSGSEAPERWLIADSYCGRPEIKLVCELSISMGPGTGSNRPNYHAINLSFTLHIDDAALEPAYLSSQDFVGSLGLDRDREVEKLELLLPASGWVAGDPAITELPGLYLFEIYRFQVELETVGDVLYGVQLNSGPLDAWRLRWWGDIYCTIFEEYFGEALPHPDPGRRVCGLVGREEVDLRQVVAESWPAGEGPDGEPIICRLGIRMLSDNYGEFYIRFELAGD
ncbi:MAG: hypothetical protein QM270_09980 [Bacillota bacterium]|nr:hypothetical protein [Bacillota bacterium]